MNGITRNQFSMVRIKLNPEGGLKYEAKLSINMDGSNYEIDRKDDVPVVPSDDLINAVRNLKDRLLTTTYIMKMKSILNTVGFNPRKDQREAVEKVLDLIVERASVTGVHVSGQDQNEGVIISGKIKAENGSMVALNTPRMRFSSSVYGFEEDLANEIRNIENELYLYLYQNKKAQLDAFDQEEQRGGVPEPEAATETSEKDYKE